MGVTPSKSASITSLLQYCRPQDIAAIAFSETVAYKGCKICDDPTSRLYKTYVRDEADCGSARIDLYRYKGTENAPCPTTGDELPYCAFTKESLQNAANSDDCPADDYQQRKRGFSQRLRACDKVLATTRAKAPPNAPSTPMSLMCPVPIFAWLKCDPTTKKCKYTSPSGNPEAAAACSNTFENCEDPEYTADKLVWEKLDANCKRQWDHQNNINFWVPAVSAVLMLVTAAGMAVSMTRGGAFASGTVSGVSGAGGNKAVATGKSAICSFGGKGILFVVVLLLLGGLWPGCVAKGLSWTPWSANAFDDASELSTWLYTGIAVTVGAVLLLFFWIAATINSSCSAASTTPTPVGSSFGNQLTNQLTK